MESRQSLWKVAYTASSARDAHKETFRCRIMHVGGLNEHDRFNGIAQVIKLHAIQQRERLPVIGVLERYPIGAPFVSMMSLTSRGWY